MSENNRKLLTMLADEDEDIDFNDFEPRSYENGIYTGIFLACWDLVFIKVKWIKRKEKGRGWGGMRLCPHVTKEDGSRIFKKVTE